MQETLLSQLKPLPEPSDRGSLNAGIERLKELAAEGGAASKLLALASAAGPAGTVLRGILGGSPFLTELILRDAEHALACLEAAPEESLRCLCETVRSTACGPDEPSAKKALRQARAHAALLVALADLGGVWDIDQSTAALTRFADAAVARAVDWLLLDTHRSGRICLLDPQHPGRGSGYAVLAMGKLGASELNFSSDIDLIVLFDPATAPLARGVEPAPFFVRLTKRLAALLQDVTEDGYAFRVDLRLRPDPRATQIAISVEAAANYYEYMGQNWERAAMIKARPATGDLALGQAFLDRLKPYIWRKYLDFAAIADIQSLKRQIHQVKGHGAIAVHGHNIKLGRGGIRDIEFFVQTQQLIAGGRNPELRGRRTLEMLEALAAAEWISEEAVHELTEAYGFLRRIEHRIQMVADTQTHDLPVEPGEFERLARFSGFERSDSFADALKGTFELVQRHSSALFEESAGLSSDAGSLVFTGGEDDPETIQTLARLGFKRPRDVSATVRGWHHGRYPATRSARARERLTEIMPALLSALARSGEPDEAFVAFDRFVAGLPTGLQLFSLLRANPDLLDLLATVLGTAPRLAQELSRRPKVLDAVIDPDFFTTLPGEAEIAAGLAAVIPEDLPLEDVLDRARVFGKEHLFRIGIRLLAQSIGPADAGAAYSRLADALIARLLTVVEREMEARHGPVPGGRAVVLAMGRLGGQEMTAGSDLDLILIYDHAPGAELSTGRKPLAVSQYYARLTQRLIAAISAPTSEGVLYQVDMRLRPSGNKGPVATHIESFRSYHTDSAWTWERLALTRARPVAGPEALRNAIEAAIGEALRLPRDARRTRAEIIDMRRRLLAEFGGRGVWDLKHTHGGLVDIEFIAQGLQILHAAESPGILDRNSANALQKLAAAGLLNSQQAEVLKRALELSQRLIHVIRLCVPGASFPEKAPQDLKRLVASAAAAPDISAAEALLADTQAEVRGLFGSIIGAV